MPSMTDCNHEWLAMGDIERKLTEQLGLVLLSNGTREIDLPPQVAGPPPSTQYYTGSS